jgi:hypothetical protein
MTVRRRSGDWNKAGRSAQLCSEMVRPTGFEPMAPRLGIPKYRLSSGIQTCVKMDISQFKHLEIKSFYCYKRALA